MNSLSSATILIHCQMYNKKSKHKPTNNVQIWWTHSPLPPSWYTVKCTIRNLNTSQQIMCRYEELTVLCHHLDTLSGGKHPDPPLPAGLAVWAVESPRIVKGVLTALVSSVEGGANKTTNAIRWNAIELRTFMQSFKFWKMQNAICSIKWIDVCYQMFINRRLSPELKMIGMLFLKKWDHILY